MIDAERNFDERLAIANCGRRSGRRMSIAVMEAECVVCLQQYDDGEHTPRVLSCGHSLCQSCTVELPAQWGGMKNGHDGGLVRCPECNQFTKLPLGGHLELPKNFELMRLIQNETRTTAPAVVDDDDSCQAKGKENGVQIARFKGKDVKAAAVIGNGVEGYGEVVPRILPQNAIKPREGRVGGFVIGDMLSLDRKLHPKLQLIVSLQVLQIVERIWGVDAQYEAVVKLAWKSVPIVVRTELVQLLTIADHCSAHVAKVLGLWMSRGGELFLVSRVCVEGIKQARCLLPITDDFTLDLEQEDGRSSSEPSKEDKNLGRTSLGTLVRLGVELCEILLEFNAAGLILFALTPDCLILDNFGHLQLHIGKISFLKDKVRHVEIYPDLKSHLVHLNLPGRPNVSEFLQGLCRGEGDLKTEYVSPEVFDHFKKHRRTNQTAENSSQQTCSHSTSADEHEGEDVVLTQKADVWSLGCLLLRIFSGSALLGGLPFSRVLSMIVHKKITQDAFGDDELPVLGHYAPVLNLLLNCFAHSPSERPQVGDIWWALKEIIDDQALGSPSLCNEASGEGFKQLDFEESGNNIQGTEIPEADSTVNDSTGIPRVLISDNPCSTASKTLHGHRDTVSSLAVCGNYLISASFDKTVRVWSLSDYRPVRVLGGHGQRITALAVHDSTKLCASGDYGGQICLWNLATGGSSSPMATWQEHQDWRYSGVASLIFSDDGVLYSGSGDRTVKAWRIPQAENIVTMEGHKGVVSALLVDGQVLYSGSWDGTVRLWWRPDHSLLAQLGNTLCRTLSGVRALVKSSDGLLVTGHDSGVIQVWDDEECVRSLEAHKAVVSALACDQSWLYSGSWDGFIKAWPLCDILIGAITPVEKEIPGSSVNSILYSPEKLCVGLLQTIQVFNR